jgi:hypothetical protein
MLGTISSSLIDSDPVIFWFALKSLDPVVAYEDVFIGATYPIVCVMSICPEPETSVGLLTNVLKLVEPVKFAAVMIVDTLSDPVIFWFDLKSLDPVVAYEDVYRSNQFSRVFCDDVVDSIAVNLSFNEAVYTLNDAVLTGLMYPIVWVTFIWPEPETSVGLLTNVLKLVDPVKFDAMTAFDTFNEPKMVCGTV